MIRARTLAAVALASVAALSLGGCMTQKLSADDATKLLGAFHAAGCGGSVDVDLQAGAGQIGGQASASVKLRGSCPEVDAPVVIPAPAPEH